jgi:phosphogluconate dehydratase
MPELHKLTPYLGVLQNRGFKVALVTDGRMSGASGKVLSAIQVTPEAIVGGPIAKIRDGDLISIDAEEGILAVSSNDDIDSREVPPIDAGPHYGTGRELFRNKGRACSEQTDPPIGSRCGTPRRVRAYRHGPEGMDVAKNARPLLTDW